MSRPNVLPAERRSSPRLSTLLACSLRLAESEIPGFLVSCSVSGALLALSSEAERGVSAAIIVEVPWLKRGISVMGRVVRTFRDNSHPQVRHRCAVEFDGITGESTLLMNLVTTRDTLGVRRFR